MHSFKDEFAKQTSSRMWDCIKVFKSNQNKTGTQLWTTTIRYSSQWRHCHSLHCQSKLDFQMEFVKGRNHSSLISLFQAYIRKHRSPTSITRPPSTLSRYHRVTPASGESPSIQKRLETGTTYTPKWRSRKSWLVQETTAYILTLSPMFLFAPVLFFCIAQTSFVTLGLFKYVPNTVRE